MATSIWGSNGGVAATPAATNRIPTDISSGGAPNHHTLQQLADLGASIGVTTQALGSINTNTTITWSSGSYVTATIAGALTFTFAGAPSSGQGFQGVLVLTNGGSAVITWPVSVTWSGGTAPTLRASGVDLLRFYTQDNGTTWFGTAENDESNVAGSSTQVLFNDGGTLAGDSGFTFNKTDNSLTIGGATVTASSPVINASQTWNSGATTFTGLQFSVTNTASASDSRLLDLSVSGTSKLRVLRDGSIYYGSDANGNVALVSGTFNTFALRARGQASIYAVDGDINIGSSFGASLGFLAGAATGTADVRIVREAAGVLAQRNGTNAQTFRVYRSYTDASNYERLAINAGASGDWLQIAAETAGTGADNIGLAFTPAGTGAISAHVPDSGTAGGNARGANAVDLQTLRTANTQVASGAQSSIGGGYANRASGQYARVGGGVSNTASQTATTVAGGTNVTASGYAATGCGGDANTASGARSVVSGGWFNTASGDNSWIPGGVYGTTRGLSGAYAYSSGQRSAAGDAQVIGQPVRRTTTDATPVSLATDGTPAATTVMALPANSTLLATAIVTCRDSSGNSAGWIAQALFKRDGSNNTTRLGTATVTAIGTPDAAVNTATIDLVANDTLEAAEIQVTGVAATTIYWCGELKCVQVA